MKLLIDKRQSLCYNETMNTIKDFINQKGMTQTELAAKLGYDVSHVSMVIRGQRRITDGFRWRWQEAFGAKAMKVLNGDDEAGK